MKQDNTTLTYAAFANAFTPAELDRIEAAGDRMALEKAEILGSAEGALHSSVRITRTGWFEPVEENKWIYDRAQQIAQQLNIMAWGFDLRGFSERIQFSVYHGEEGGHYVWHVDQGPLAVRRKLSMTLQLTDPSKYQGGELQFHATNQIETAPKDRGMLIAFPSYVLHRVAPVTAGTRKSLVIWITGPRFV